MKERGIIFNTEMVRAILDGRKTQTRRALTSKNYLKITKASGCGEFHPESLGDKDTQEFYCQHSPFGQIGDRLWVRETYSLLGNEDACPIDWNDNIVNDKTEAARIYRASCVQKSGDYGLWSIPDEADWKPHTEEMKFEGSWTPSIHMPRWASRITLEITDVRVERLQEASDDDFKAEGYPLERELTGGSTDAFCWFRHLWDSVSKPDCNYESNPWVWVIEFKRV
ncbi:hypothetical protein L7834_012100 [Providencia rettgeri]|uniref:hypothetical protein n=1 Tax=Providencia rettgeri TaxID=587 RepID=UPI001EE69B11|nr:hypothetical protein [Providencia rettgeri]MCG5370424.1 hypothetical protein [Providencia rettgeri]